MDTSPTCLKGLNDVVISAVRWYATWTTTIIIRYFEVHLVTYLKGACTRWSTTIGIIWETYIIYHS